MNDEGKKALDYIEKYWPKLERFNPKDTGTLIGLPHKYIVPAVDAGTGFQFNEQYYWDSYFTVLGMNKPEHQELVEGMLENLIVLFKRFGLIPNASRMYFTGRSQPPLLTSYIFLVYDRYGKSKAWLKEKMKWARMEYETVWLGVKHPLWHRAYRGLSRYYEVNALHDLAEAESGWDMTPRFERKCLEFLPIDLNSLLYKYETDFARAATILGNKKEADEWNKWAKERQDTVSDLMWGRNRKFFFDYNYQTRGRGRVWSLAAYFTMWSGLASKDQAAHMARHVRKFMAKGGLVTTTRPLINLNIFGSIPTQWAYPNGWAPLHYIVIEGLKKYGYDDLAANIAHKWIRTNLDWFGKHGTFLEKYNVVNTDRSQGDGVYPNQVGFGWTNSVFARLYEDYGEHNGSH